MARVPVRIGKAKKTPGVLTFRPRQETIENLGFKTAPTGQYEVILREWKYLESSEKKTPGVQLQVEIVNAEDEAHNGARPWSWVSLGSPFFWEALVAFIPTDEWEALEGAEIDESEIRNGTWDVLTNAKGNTAMANCVLEAGKDGNRDRFSVKNYLYQDSDEEEEEEEDEEEDEDDA